MIAAAGSSPAVLVARRRRASRSPSSCCRSSRSSCASRRASCSPQLGSDVVIDALVVTPEDQRDRAGADPPRRHAGRVLPRESRFPRPRARRSRSSSCRSSCRPAVARDRAARRVRPPRPARRHVRRARDHDRLHPDGGRPRVRFVAGPFYVRQAIASFEALDQRAARRLAHARRGPARTFFRIALPLAGERPRRGRGALASPAASASSAPRSCSPAASRASPRPSRSPSTPQFDLDFDVALALGALLVVVSAADPASPSSSIPAWTRSTLDIALPLRSFRARASARRSGARPSRWSAPRAPARRRCCARSPGLVRPERGAIALDGEVLFDRGRDRPSAGGARASGSSSRSTRSSRT